MSQDQNNQAGMAYNLQQGGVNPNMQPNPQYGMMGGMGSSLGGSPVPQMPMQAGMQPMPGMQSIQGGVGGAQTMAHPPGVAQAVPQPGQTGNELSRVNQHVAKSGEKTKKKIKIAIRDRTVLYNSWMNFTKTGALFIPSDESFEMGDEVLLILSVMEYPKSFILLCKVCWITASSSNANHPKGIGIMFPGDDNGKAAKSACEMNLAGLLDNPRPTYTM